MKSKSLTAVLAIALLLPALSGCTKDSTGSDNSVSTITGAAGISAQKVFDLGGRNIRIGVVENTIIPKDTGGPIQQIILSRISEAERIYNCKILWERYWKSDSYSQDLTKLYADISAGTSVYDMVQAIPSKAFPSIIARHLALPLDDYIDFKHGLYSSPVHDVSLWDGKHYGVFWSIYHDDRMLLMYNKTMLESQALDNPLDMMLQNRWDWDVFLDYAKKCTRDKDGDGLNDVWGIIDGSTVQLLYALILSNGGPLSKNVNGKDIYALDSQASLEATDFLISLYKEHKVVMDSATYYNHTGNILQLSYEDFTKKGMGAFYLVSSVFARGTINNNRYETVMFPKGKNADKYVSYALYNFIMIPSSVEDPEQIAEIMELVFSIGDNSKELYMTFDTWADNYKNSSNADNSREYENLVEMMKIINSNTIFPLYFNSGLISILIYMDLEKIINDKNSKDARTMIDDLKIPIQDEINKLWQ